MENMGLLQKPKKWIINPMKFIVRAWTTGHAAEYAFFGFADKS
jgi:hypothetical protein